MRADETEGSSGKQPSPQRIFSLVYQAKPSFLQLKSSRTGIIRVAPPLVISDSQLDQALEIIKESIQELLALPAAA
jgi:4-aminobutyrate aminotransferase-like enzyme